ncbi:hypothetical protein ACIRRH_31755 [Kitasatospora sp. NPDC101235]|uniref:hypothetical protein n=1 Tax=Kitasatospora sp. NPDC101235 TaxID=3364101 RepID=UPI003827F591
MTAPTAQGLPPVGWQHDALPLLRAWAAAEPRIRDLRVHGSAAEGAEGLDRWSDLDLVVTSSSDPQALADDFAGLAGGSLGPIYTSSRNSDEHSVGIRLVLRDLRRIDLTVRSATVREPAPAVPPRETQEVLAELVNAYRFDAVLAAVKAARGDVLIGSHLALQLPRHLRVAAMILRDRDTGTNHHRHGGTSWDSWAHRLAAATQPYSPPAITSAIRFHTHVLHRLLAEQAPKAVGDEQPLLALLDAVDSTVD